MVLTTIVFLFHVFVTTGERHWFGRNQLIKYLERISPFRNFMLPKRRFLEIGTSDLRVSVAARPPMAVGERRRALFKGVSTQFGQSNVEKYFEKTWNRLFQFPKFFVREHKSVNYKSRLNYLTNCSKWRLSKKRGLVTYAWSQYDVSIFLDATICCTIFAIICSPHE